MTLRLVSAIAALAVVAGLASGCVPEPTSSPSPTGFASEEEAFAAAEATYRAYVDALNQVDLSDPETFEAVYAWTTGEANANERKTLSQMHGDNWQVSGDTLIFKFQGDAATLTQPSSVEATVCTDVSGIDVTDSEGNSVVTEARPDRYTLEVQFLDSDTTSTGLAISASNATEGETCGSP